MQNINRSLRVFILFIVWVAEWPPFGKELLIRLTICSLCIFTIYNLRYFPFWFLGLDLDSDCFSSWPLHTFNFYKAYMSFHLCDVAEITKTIRLSFSNDKVCYVSLTS